ncbi:MAG: hypothetical protein ABSC06_35420 [Rhodopila sp.]
MALTMAGLEIGERRIKPGQIAMDAPQATCFAGPQKAQTAAMNVDALVIIVPPGGDGAVV